MSSDHALSGPDLSWYRFVDMVLEVMFERGCSVPEAEVVLQAIKPLCVALTQPLKFDGTRDEVAQAVKKWADGQIGMLLAAVIAREIELQRAGAR